MWTLQSAETKNYSVHGGFVASVWPTHREYAYVRVTQHEGLIAHQKDGAASSCSTSEGQRGPKVVPSMCKVSLNKWVQFYGEISLAKLSQRSFSEIAMMAPDSIFQFGFLFLSSVIFSHLVTKFILKSGLWRNKNCILNIILVHYCLVYNLTHQSMKGDS